MHFSQQFHIVSRPSMSFLTKRKAHILHDTSRYLMCHEVSLDSPSVEKMENFDDDTLTLFSPAVSIIVRLLDPSSVQP